MNGQEQTVRCIHHPEQRLLVLVADEGRPEWRARWAMRLCWMCWARLAAARWMRPRALPSVPLAWGSLQQDYGFHEELRREGARP